jgi:uncharacterized membrane protein YozB (DUF420 family)
MFGTYGVFLYVHSFVRWLVIAAGLVTVIRAWRGRLGQHAWLKADTATARLFVIAIDVQALLGVALYGLFSPEVAGAFSNVDRVMQSRHLRFWMLEHPLAGTVALALVHIGFAKAKRGGATAHRDASLYFTLAVVIALAAIPWPIFTFGRLLWPIW